MKLAPGPRQLGADELEATTVTVNRSGRRRVQVRVHHTELVVPGGYRLAVAALAGFHTGSRPLDDRVLTRWREIDASWSLDIETPQIDPGSDRYEALPWDIYERPCTPDDSPLAELVHRTLDDARDRGQILAVADGSRWPVGAAFGFGLATETATAIIDVRRAGLMRHPAEGLIEPIPAEKLSIELPEPYERCTAARAGSVRRTASMWRGLERSLTAAGQLHVFAHHDPGRIIDGYAICAVDADGSQTVIELLGASPSVERALWNHLLSVAQHHYWLAPRRPVDDLARLAVSDPGAYRCSGRDPGLWMRLLDVDVALGSRSYQPTLDHVNLRVHDSRYRANTGTWRIDGFGSHRTHGRPELEAGIGDLAATYLGSTSWIDLVRAGRAVEHRSGAALIADALFATDPSPFDHGFEVRGLR